jgi:hypothetical protein
MTCDVRELPDWIDDVLLVAASIGIVWVIVWLSGT